MNVGLTIKNYRCFPQTDPLRLSLRDGFTAFVGSNNSGKSSVFRFLFEFRGLFERLSQDENFVRQTIRRPTAFSFQGVLDTTEVFSNRNQGDLEVLLDLGADSNDEPEGPPPLQQVLITIQRNTNSSRVQIMSPAIVNPDVAGSALAVANWALHVGGKPLVDLNRLRNAASLLSSTVYMGPFRNVVNTAGNAQYLDMQIGQDFVKTWRVHQSGKTKVLNEAIDRLVEDIRVVFGFERLQITPSEDDSTLQLMVNGRSFKLAEVGSGMAQFVLLLANAVIERPALILIDEPELNLHPSLQPVLLDNLLKHAEAGVLFSTHSIGLARAVADRIYVFRQIEEGRSDVRQLEAGGRFLPEFLGELSYSAYREIGYEKVLLVEGRYDTSAIRELLRLYRKDSKAFLLPLGGSAMINGHCETELQETKRIADDISVLIDSERGAANAPLSPDRQAFVEVCKRVNIPCRVLHRRAFENYLPDHAVKAVKGEAYSALGDYQALKDCAMPWAKRENWQIAAKMTLDDLEGTDLGEFLDAL